MTGNNARPQWWDEDCEVILRFVRRYRLDRQIKPGTPIPWLVQESELGFYIFGDLAYTPEFEGGWSHLANPVERKAVLNRINNAPQCVAA